MQLFSQFVAWCVALFYNPNYSEEPDLAAGQGEFGEYFLQQVKLRGGRIASEEDLPEVTGEWSFSEDDHGVICHLPQTSFPAVEAFLRHAFGEPAESPSPTDDGGVLGWYGTQDIGVAIQFGHDNLRTEVILLKPVSPLRLLAEIPKSYLRK